MQRQLFEEQDSSNALRISHLDKSSITPWANQSIKCPQPFGIALRHQKNINSIRERCTRNEKVRIRKQQHELQLDDKQDKQRQFQFQLPVIHSPLPCFPKLKTRIKTENLQHHHSPKASERTLEEQKKSQRYSIQHLTIERAVSLSLSEPRMAKGVSASSYLARIKQVKRKRQETAIKERATELQQILAGNSDSLKRQEVKESIDCEGTTPFRGHKIASPSAFLKLKMRQRRNETNCV